MKRRTKIALLIGGGLLLATPPALYMAAPSIARWYVLKNYPDVKSIGEIDISTNGVSVSDIRAERPGIKAEIDSVFVSYEKEIWVKGGKVEANIDQMPKKKPGSGSKSRLGPIHAENLTVSATWGKLQASLAAVRVEPHEVCFETGTVHYSEFQNIRVELGCVQRETKAIALHRAVFHFDLPINLPKIQTGQRVELGLVEADWKAKRANIGFVSLFDKEEKSPHTKLTKLKVSIQEDKIEAGLDSISTNHPWLYSGSDGYMTTNGLFVILPRGILNGHRDQNIVLGQGTLEPFVQNVGVTINPARWQFKAERSTCARWMQAVPGAPAFMSEEVKFAGMPPSDPVPGWDLVEGELGFEVQVKPKPKLKLHYSCKMDCRHPAIQALKKRFAYMAYDKDDKPFERTVDRSGPEWTPIRALPGHVLKAFITFEDPYFEHHRGVMQSALFNSLKQNLQLGRFHRGGSTITMQLAKNLWLGRQKTVTRKAHEIMLASILEGCFSKSQILELYINIVEFGPDVYGIGPAARHWFDKYPSELEPDEAFWLARILPRPKRARPPDEGGLERVRKLMAKMAEQDVIPEHFITEEDPLEMEDEEDFVSE